MSDNNSSRSGGIGFLGLLTILFIGLKLTHYIDWEWLWVLSPLWIPFSLFLAIVLIVLVIKLLAAAFGSLFGRRRQPWERY